MISCLYSFMSSASPLNPFSLWSCSTQSLHLLFDIPLPFSFLLLHHLPVYILTISWWHVQHHGKLFCCTLCIFCNFFFPLILIFLTFPLNPFHFLVTSFSAKFPVYTSLQVLLPFSFYCYTYCRTKFSQNSCNILLVSLDSLYFVCDFRTNRTILWHI